MTVVDWTLYQRCPVCGALLAMPCLKQTGYDESGLVAVAADRPHGGRKLRAGADRG